MQRSRKLVAAAAAACWGHGLGIAIASPFGVLPGQGWTRVFVFLLSSGVTLSLTLVITTHVLDPRTAYRLGWEARGRHERIPDAPVVQLDEQRRA